MHPYLKNEYKDKVSCFNNTNPRLVLKKTNYDHYFGRGYPIAKVIMTF